MSNAHTKADHRKQRGRTAPNRALHKNPETKKGNTIDISNKEKSK